MSESIDDEILSDDSKVMVGLPSDGSSHDTKDESFVDESLIYYDSKEESQDANSQDGDSPVRFDATTNSSENDVRRLRPSLQMPISMRAVTERLSKHIDRGRASVAEALPDTPAGWTILSSAIAAIGLAYEINLQRSLTHPPHTFGQIPADSAIHGIYEKLTSSPESILSRSIQPSLLVGTRGMLSSTAAYLLGGPASSTNHLRFREVVQSSIDGASFGVDWEVPWKSNNTQSSNLIESARKKEILQGVIREPVVLILHGINNDASFGYMRSLQRSFVNRGWNAAAMNFRGCGGIPMTTPRGYNASNTNDLRSLVWTLSGRMAENVPLFLVGNSLGASIVTKYLGEEGLSGTLPTCVSGAASLGNPLSINSSVVSFPFNVLMALGVKKTFVENMSVFSKMTDSMFRRALVKTLISPTIAQLDNNAAPIQVRNEPFYPFAFRVGFKDGNSYWLDSSCYRLVRYISVPYLNLAAEDDFLVAASTKNRLGFCLSNPNVMVAETRCGGHLGWQEKPPDSQFGATSWADTATSDFFDAIMRTNLEKYGTALSPHSKDTSIETFHAESSEARQALKVESSRYNLSNLKSRL